MDGNTLGLKKSDKAEMSCANGKNFVEELYLDFLSRHKLDKHEINATLQNLKSRDIFFYFDKVLIFIKNIKQLWNRLGEILRLLSGVLVNIFREIKPFVSRKAVKNDKKAI